MSDYELTSSGRLKYLSQWSEAAATWLAKRENLILTDAHWEILNLMRAYYENYNISPIRKLLKKEIREKLCDAKAEDGYLDKLFPNDVLAQGTRIAGLPIPLMDVEIEHAPVVVSSSSVNKPVADVKFFVSFIPYEGKKIPVEAKGNLSNMDDWSEPLAIFMAKKEGIELTPAHWEVIHFLRRFYFKYGLTPMVRLLMKNLRDDLDATRGSKEYVYNLFPDGPSRQGSRFAGLPEPQGCIED